MKSLKKVQLLLMFAAILLLLHIAPDQASAAANVSAKIKEGLKQVQTLLTGLVVTVGICVSIWIIIKKLPGVDDPHTKNEMFRGVGMALAGVGLAAAIVWLVPWMYALFA
ncbi:CagC family type IV secretion system protein [Peribacillus butanolivorans]|uniref:CagC family type IV secretion system protein n=1 Tax=Peribacillus butanolivorans TaxID=421767 RepID=UPI00366D170B